MAPRRRVRIRSLLLQRATRETAWPTDSSPHSIQFITVDNSVKLEVLDWGGSGRPLVLLAGLGDTAHVHPPNVGLSGLLRTKNDLAAIGRRRGKF